MVMPQELPVKAVSFHTVKCIQKAVKSSNFFFLFWGGDALLCDLWDLSSPAEIKPVPSA